MKTTSGWHHRLSQARSTQHICACSQSTLAGASKLVNFSTRIQVTITEHNLINMFKTGGSRMHHGRIFVGQNCWGTDFSFNGALRTGAFEQSQWTQDLRLGDHFQVKLVETCWDCMWLSCKDFLRTAQFGWSIGQIKPGQGLRPETSIGSGNQSCARHDRRHRLLGIDPLNLTHSQETTNQILQSSAPA